MFSLFRPASDAPLLPPDQITPEYRRLRRQVFPWWALRLATPFWKMAPELLEMRYLWEQEVLLDDAKLLAFLGPTAQTPLVSALRRAFQESTLQLEPAIAS